MDDFYDTCDSVLSENDGLYEITLDVPSTGVSGISDIYDTLGSFRNIDSMRTAAASLSESCRKISEMIRPALSSYFAASETVASMMKSMTESVKPLATMCAMEGASSAVEKLRDSFALSTAVKEELLRPATCNLASIAEQLQMSSATHSALTTALTSSIQPSLAGAMKPLVDSYAIKGIPAITENARAALLEGSALTNSLSDITQSALAAVKPASVGILSSVQSAIGSLTDKVKAAFDVSRLTAAIRAFDCSDIIRRIREKFANTAARISEMMQTIWDKAGRTPCGLIRLLLLYLRAAWRRRRFRPPIHESIKESAVLVNVGLSQPKQVREFAVQIQQIYLFRRQDRGSSDEDGNVITIAATC